MIWNINLLIFAIFLPTLTSATNVTNGSTAEENIRQLTSDSEKTVNSVFLDISKVIIQTYSLLNDKVKEIREIISPLPDVRHASRLLQELDYAEKSLSFTGERILTEVDNLEEKLVREISKSFKSLTKRMECQQPEVIQLCMTRIEDRLNKIRSEVQWITSAFVERKDDVVSQIGSCRGSESAVSTFKCQRVSIHEFVILVQALPMKLKDSLIEMNVVSDEVKPQLDRCVPKCD